MNRRALLVFLFVLSCGISAKADDLWLASDGEFPGRLRLSQGGREPRVFYTRTNIPNPAYPRAVMKAAQIAVGVDGAIYYCSGLDGSLMHLLDGRNEIQVAEVTGQVRDLACTGEAHTLYYSVVPTPQNGEPLADGVIYRRDFWSGSPEVVATIRQSDVGGNWWGSFTIRDGEIYLSTLDAPSRLFRWSGGALTRVYETNRMAVKGIAVSERNQFLVTDGTGDVWETGDFQSLTPLLRTTLPLRDVASKAIPASPRP
ncbi:MAG: hypothetical protein U0905_17360 [Pirellulales bacterium]